MLIGWSSYLQDKIEAEKKQKEQGVDKPEPSSKLGLGLLLIGLIFIALGFFWRQYQNSPEVLNKKAEEEFKQACEDNRMAYIQSNDYIKTLLKSPTTAKFPMYKQNMLTDKNSSTCTFTFSSYVDSQNGFGAMVRTYYSFKMQGIKDKKQWLSIAI